MHPEQAASALHESEWAVLSREPMRAVLLISRFGPQAVLFKVYGEAALLQVAGGSTLVQLLPMIHVANIMLQSLRLSLTLRARGEPATEQK